MNKEEIIILKGFRKQVEKLNEHKQFFQSIGFSLNFQQNVGVNIESKKIPENITKAFLMDFRPLFMNDSKYNIGRVCNLILKNTDDNKIKEDIKKAREVWNKILEKKSKYTPFNGVLLKINNNVLKSDDNLNRWINEGYFHPDQDNGLKEILSNPIFENMSYMNFIDQLQKMSQLVIWLNNNVVSKILNTLSAIEDEK
jgi:hypothetical protein